MEPTNTLTREQWLNLLAERFREGIFKEMAPGFQLPDKLRISVGWPSKNGLGRKKRTIGQCWSPECSQDQTTEIFISPFLGDPHKAASTTLHEMIHAAVGNECGHKGQFVSCAKKLGFLAPWTQTPESEDLQARIQGVLRDMPEFPHASLDPVMVEKLTKKQGTRMVKAKCEDCGYTARTTRKWLEDKGAPICPCNHEAMAVDGADADGDGDGGDDGSAGEDRLAA